MHQYFHLESLIVSVGCWMLCCTLCAWTTYKIFINLYRFSCIQIKCIKCCCVTFDKDQNWINPPSSANKLYAFIGLTNMTLSYICYLVIYSYYIYQTAYTATPKRTYLEIIPRSLFGFSHLLYLLYMISTLEFLKRCDELINVVISNKLVIMIKILSIVFIILWTSYSIIWCILAEYDWTYNGIPYAACIICALFITQTIIEISFLCSFISGLNNVAHFWYSKCWKEYEECGTTQKIHEVLITITRATVMVIARTITTSLWGVWAAVNGYILISNKSNELVIFGNCMTQILWTADTLVASLSIHFIYHFGYNDYRKICSICHHSIYTKCEKRHHTQVEQGGFDGIRYRKNPPSATRAETISGTEETPIIRTIPPVIRLKSV